MFSPLLSPLAILAITSGQASATVLSKRQTPEALTDSQIDEFIPFTHFASAAYCPPNEIQPWSCGVDCDTNEDFIPHTTGGNGEGVQYWYVGFSGRLESVIVAHQGTQLTDIESLTTDIDVFLTNLDPNLFPGISSSVEVHHGFAADHAQSANDILSAVQKTISEHNATQVTIVGHSLGGALALLDGVFLPLHIQDVSFRTVTYGLPRVGNQAFADYVDAHASLIHINNKNDPVPLLPPNLLGYEPVSGEIHITEDNRWMSCPGQDNEDPQCTAGGLRLNLGDHDGPYNEVIMGAGCLKNA